MCKGAGVRWKTKVKEERLKLAILSRMDFTREEGRLPDCGHPQSVLYPCWVMIYSREGTAIDLQIIT